MALKDQIYPVTSPCTLLPFLLEHVKGQSRNSVKNLLARGQAVVDGNSVTRFDHPLSPGQSVTVLAAPPAAGRLPFQILYEDRDLLAIHKPAGLLTVATDLEREDTAYRMLTDYVHAENPGARVFLVHRLDRDTSGVLLFARREPVKRALQDRWSQAVLTRGYSALVEGVPPEKSGTVRSFLHETKLHMVYSGGKGGKEAVTRYRVRLQGGQYALLDLELATGRKNQIRVHMHDLGCPVAGDRKYGAATDPLKRLCLHAGLLRLRHPVTGEELTLAAPEPPGFRQILERAAR